MKNNLLQLCVKYIIFISSIVLMLLPLATKVHDYKSKYEPRRSLVNRVDMKGYLYALIGDSVFCSYYVNNDIDTIWKKFESITGHKMYPGALDGSKNSDLVNAAKYISKKMPAYSTVFINIHPLKFILMDQDRKNNYGRQFADLFQEHDFAIYKYLNYLDVNYMDYIQKSLHNTKYELDTKVHYNRVWNIDGDFANKRYLAFLAEKHRPVVSDENLKILSEINQILRENKINAIFILTPLNKDQIYTYSGIPQADNLYFKLNEIHDTTRKYLSKINALSIDLFESMPADCFADLIHTNACGDEIIAKHLADYKSKPLK